MNVCPDDERLLRYHAQELPRPESDWIRQHVDACARCADQLASAIKREEQLVSRLRDAVRNGRSVPEASPGHAAPGSRADASPPPIIPEYDLLKRIGSGGFGHVWLAKHRLTGLLHAVKIISRAGGAQGDAAQLELEGIRRVKERIAGHPHLIPIEHVGQTDASLYYVMPLADDARGSGVYTPDGYEPMTLSDELRRRGPLPVDEAIAITRAVLSGLECLHTAGLLHRDVKPANVFRCAGRWQLGDTGLVARHGRLENRAGTPLYAPAEGVVERSGDLYCTGTMLAELVSGRTPRTGVDPFAVRASAGSRAPKDVASVIARACDPDPARRFQTAAEMSACLSPGRPWRVSPYWLVAAALLASVAWLRFAGVSPRESVHRPDSSARTDHPAAPELMVEWSPSPHSTARGPLDEFALPLRTGNVLYLRGRLPEASYPYVFLLSAAEPPQCLYPDEDRSVEPVAEFVSPIPQPEHGPRTSGWELENPPGTKVVLMVVLDEPVADVSTLSSELARVGVPQLDARTMWVGDPERPQVIGRRDRGVRKVPTSAAPSLLDSIGGTIRNRIRSARMIAFPHVDTRETR
ncbi:MAG: serine/threonine protein kinase [Phycisphaerae bacterium]|nr:serine/threonine protein kinase [Phycisphaerae bacterium]